MFCCRTAAPVHQDPRPHLPGSWPCSPPVGAPLFCSVRFSHLPFTPFHQDKCPVQHSLTILTFQAEHGSFAFQLTPWLKLKAPPFVFFPHVLSSLIFSSFFLFVLSTLIPCLSPQIRSVINHDSFHGDPWDWVGMALVG